MIQEVNEKYRNRLELDYNAGFDRQKFVNQSILEQNEREIQQTTESKPHKNAKDRFNDRMQSLDVTKTVDDLYRKLTPNSSQCFDKNCVSNKRTRKDKIKCKKINEPNRG